MKSIKVYTVIVSVLALIGLTIKPAMGLTYTWTGNAGNSRWDDAGNWNPTIPAFPPNSSTTNVVITKPDTTVNVYGHATAGALTMDSSDTLVINPQGMAGVGMQFRLGALGGAATTVDNDGLIQLNRGPYSVLSADAATVTLTGNGQVALWGDNFSSGECSFSSPNTVVNSAGHCIVGGGGTIAVANITNQGAITATHGTLICNSNITQSSAPPMGTMNSSPGNILELRNHITGGVINPNGGNVTLNAGVSLTNLSLGGGPFDTVTHSNLSGNIGLAPDTVFNVNNGHILNLWADGSTPCTITNYGVINLKSSGGGAALSARAPVTLTGTGSVTMGGDINNQLGNAGVSTQIYINDSSHTIQGGGTIATATINNGKIIANNGTMSLTGMVTGSGSVDVHGATLSVTPGLQCGNFSMDAAATLNLPTNGGIMDLKGNYTFAQNVPAQVNFGNWKLQMSSGGGGGKQFLEVGGQDLDSETGGFSNNFQLPRLALAEPGTYVCLVDNIDNGHWDSGREALYVGGYWTNTTLSVLVGTTLDLNGIKLYAYLNNAICRVRAGDGALFGGGKIINSRSSSMPGTLLLLLN